MRKCAVKGCRSNTERIGENHRFFRIPNGELAREKLRRKLWVDAIKIEVLHKEDFVCERHFQSGQPAPANEISNEDWIPNINLPEGDSDSAANPEMEQPLKKVAMLARPEYLTTPPSNDAHIALPGYCRLCLTEDGPMVVPKEAKAFHQLAMKINVCLQMTISVDELHNSLMCKKCYEALEQSYQFRLRCLRYNTYLKMRRSLDPDRSQPLRYKDNWYWYSCLGNNLKSVYWGCSVVCCPAYIITYPSGKVLENFARHQHKQKLDEVRLVYGSGEFLYDGFRYSFDMINTNRTLQFSCRSLNDPYKKCSAILTSNDKSEVLSVSEHNHPMETILESALRESGLNEKRSVTMIRGQHLELVVCLGFWYGTMAEHSRVSHWDCIRPNCTGSITMTDGVMQLHGGHNHQPVWLKWGAAASKANEAKVPMVMKIIHPTVSKQQPAKKLPPPVNVVKPTASQPTPGQIIVRSAASLTEVPTPVNVKMEQAEPAVQPDPVVTIKGEVIDPEYNDTAEQEYVQSATENSNVPLVVAAANVRASCSNQWNKQQPGGTITIRQNHPIKIIRPTSSKSIVQIAPKPSTGIPKILNVMSLSDQPKSVQVPEPLILTKSEEELAAGGGQHDEEDDAETITDEVLPDSAVQRSQQGSPEEEESTAEGGREVRPMMLVSSGSVTSDNTLKVTALDQFNMAELTQEAAIQEAEPDEDDLCDLIDDEELPGIIPVDIKLYQGTYATTAPPVQNPVVDEPPKRLSNSALSGKPAPVKVRHSLPAVMPPQKTVISMKKPVHPIAMVAKLNDREPIKRIGSKVFQIHNTTIKKFKADSTTAPQKQPVQVAPQTPEDSDPLMDPIAVASEPHETVDVNQNDEARTETVTLVKPMQRKLVVHKPTSPTKQPPAPPQEQPNAKTVQLVKLQKSEQMLNFEGHLYKIKWRNGQFFYWDCMLREQVSCMAILETPTDTEATDQWIRHGTHNHKIPKPIANEDSSGRYQMFNASTGIGKLKRLPVRTLSAAEVEEQKGRMMYLKKNKLLSYAVQKGDDGKLVLNYANFLYDLQEELETGFRWKCTTCTSMLDTDERFSIAKTVGVMHNHGPKVPVIDLALEELTPDSAAEKSTATAEVVSSSQDDKSENEKVEEEEGGRVTESEQEEKSQEAGADPLSKSQTSELEKNGKPEKKVLRKLKLKSKSADKGEKSDSSAEDTASRKGIKVTKKAKDIPKKPKVVEQSEESVASEVDQDESEYEGMVLDPSSGQLISIKELEAREIAIEEQIKEKEAKKPVSTPEEKSDDEEMVLDPASGQLITRLNLKRKENRAALLNYLEDKDEDATVLDPLTGEFKRQGDLNSTRPADPVEDPIDDIQDKPEQSAQDVPKEDFEELLSATSKTADSTEATEPQKSPPKRLKKGSLAMLKLIAELHKGLLKPNPERNFEVIPRPDSTCWIKLNEFPYMLEKLQSNGSSLWCCALSPQYACRAKLVLDEARKLVTPSFASHGHAATLRDMFDGHEPFEQGEIKDSDQDQPRKYTFSKQPDFVYQLKLDDDYLYNCLTISKTGVSCWRCASRQAHNCKAMVTMQGDFEFVTRNRFAHSHGTPGADGEVEEKGAANDDGPEEEGSKSKRDSVGDEDGGEVSRKKRKRQTM